MTTTSRAPAPVARPDQVGLVDGIPIYQADWDRLADDMQPYRQLPLGAVMPAQLMARAMDFTAIPTPDQHPGIVVQDCFITSCIVGLQRRKKILCKLRGIRHEYLQSRENRQQ